MAWMDSGSSNPTVSIKSLGELYDLHDRVIPVNDGQDVVGLGNKKDVACHPGPN